MLVGSKGATWCIRYTRRKYECIKKSPLLWRRCKNRNCRADDFNIIFYGRWYETFQGRYGKKKNDKLTNQNSLIESQQF